MIIYQKKNMREVVDYNIQTLRSNYYALDASLKILDVGGAEQPNPKATHVLDIMPFTKTNNISGKEYSEVRYSEDTWTQMDICDGNWPFPDNYFDFVWCSQVLEDIRDPIVVCREMSRVGKAGYINSPSKLSELLPDKDCSRYGVEYNGFWHHRWLMTQKDNKLIFEQKTSFATVDKLVDNEIKEILMNNKHLIAIDFHWRDEIKAEERIMLDGKTAHEELKAYIIEVKNRYR